MRLDKFLKISRIIKRRTIAKEVCDSAKVLVNGKPEKASYDVKLDDIIEVKSNGNIPKIKVIKLSEFVRKEDVSKLYEVITPKIDNNFISK